MSRNPHHENLSQAVLYHEGVKRRGKEFANTNPDIKVRREGLKRVGQKLARVTLAGAAVVGTINALAPRHGADDSEKAKINVKVEEGATPWDLAEEYYPGEDPRAVVDGLQSNPAMEDGLQPGERISLEVAPEVAEQFQREREQANQQAGGK